MLKHFSNAQAWVASGHIKRRDAGRELGFWLTSAHHRKVSSKPGQDLNGRDYPQVSTFT